MFDKINKRKGRYETLILLGGFLIFFSFIAILGFESSFFIVSLVIGGGIILYSNDCIKKMSIEFKNKYIPEALNKVFEDSFYKATEGFYESELTSTRILTIQDRYKSEDLISGSFEGVNFRSADVHQQDVRRHGKTTTIVTVFKGRVYEFDFFKNFKYNLLLLQPGKYRPFDNFKKIKLESIQFNSEFKIYAKNEHEAFYILTPHFMEKLLVLDYEYYDKIYFSFKDNKLYIAIDNRIDNFDIRPFRSLDESVIDEYVNEFNIIKDFITYLKLDSRLFEQQL